MDDDLGQMSREQLMDEVKRLRQGIRPFNANQFIVYRQSERSLGYS